MAQIERESIASGINVWNQIFSERDLVLIAQAAIANNPELAMVPESLEPADPVVQTERRL